MPKLSVVWNIFFTPQAGQFVTAVFGKISKKVYFSLWSANISVRLRKLHFFQNLEQYAVSKNASIIFFQIRLLGKTLDNHPLLAPLQISYRGIYQSVTSRNLFSVHFLLQNFAVSLITKIVFYCITAHDKKKLKIVFLSLSLSPVVSEEIGKFSSWRFKRIPSNWILL